MKTPKPSFIAIMSAIAIHGVFSIQAVFAAPSGGMVQKDVFYVLFHPHILLIYFLPPNYPIQVGAAGEVTVDWLRFSGKLLGTIPASILYGFFIAFLYSHAIQKNEDA